MNNQWILMIEGYPMFGKPIGCNQIHQLASLPGTTDWLVISKGFQYIAYLCLSMFLPLSIYVYIANYPNNWVDLQ
jgi:hypothetical protein